MQRRTISFGGDGGHPFSARIPRKVGLRTGGYVDAIIINDEQFGGDGGNRTNDESLDRDDYWTEINIRSGGYVDYLRLVSRKGREVGGGGGGGSESKRSDLRVISISGRTGGYVDQLSFDVIDGYKPSRMVQKNAEVVLDVETGGQVFKRFRNETVRTMHSYQLVTQHMEEWSVNVSAEVEYGAKFSASTGYKNTASTTETVASEATRQVESGQSSEQTISSNEAAFLIGRMDIMLDSDGTGWMAPTSDADWVVLPREKFANLSGKYDLTSGTTTQTGLNCEEVNGFLRLKAT
jgi:hypothetical protein